MADGEKVEAALVVIGNEILSGRTQDRNVAFLGGALGEIGIMLAQVRIVPDRHEDIIEAVNELRRRYAYVFTTGGIGPTHDDITAEAIARAFGVALHHHPEAMAILEAYYRKGEFNEARQRMARTPVGAVLVENPVSKAPGFRMENVYCFAGIPAVMQAMFGSVRHELDGGARMLSATVPMALAEGDIADRLEAIQKKYPDVEIGSYPYYQKGRYGTNIVLRSVNDGHLAAAESEVKEMAFSSRPNSRD